MENQIPILIICLIIFFLISEFLGRTKHIGRWWTFILLSTSFIFGIFALILSPSAKKKPTKGTTAHYIWGWICITLGIINIISSVNIGLESSQPLFGLGLAFIFLGIYLILLYLGKIVNHNPRYYLDSKKPLQKTLYPQTSNQNTNTNHIYYIVENSLQSEPLNFNQLKDKKIHEDSLIWRNGLENWIKAKDLSEVKNIIYYAPPPLPNIVEEKKVKLPDYSLGIIEDNISQEENTTKYKNINPKKKKISFYAIFLMILLILSILIIYHVVNSTISDRNKHYYTSTPVNDTVNLASVADSSTSSIPFKESDYPPSNHNYAPSSPVEQTKYFFVVFHVREKEITDYVEKVYVSGIGDANQYEITEDFKYKIMDEVSYKYLNSGEAKIYKGTILDRNFLMFDSYTEASRSREKYLIGD